MQEATGSSQVFSTLIIIQLDELPNTEFISGKTYFNFRKESSRFRTELLFAVLKKKHTVGLMNNINRH